ncbi:DUF2637 domain-containing protein [Streptomyces swartbergensis]|uniref:DUF2637 domain-containing protein n=1 Tax=Streptomyces swartbergensis TaxID=487165 RepID=A0A243RS35_9ACTN|nr:DUF2637 domain-containing protein [Streptomyces swartbergensis]OUC97812.1 hypothetical protein CA983_29935 [Streptomyces swartbergensis]
MMKRNRARPPVTPDRGRPKWLNRLGWRVGLGIIAPAAAGIVAWSLYVVAHDMYGVPKLLAVLVAACFDGAALACLYLASEAVRENRSAVAPRLATLVLAGISIYLNRLHALHIEGGLGATLLFAAPTVALLLIADLSWAATRARHRIDRGERPMRLPVFGWLGWLLAGEEAWDQTKRRAVEHVTGASSGDEPAPSGGRGAVDVIAAELAEMPPTKAVRLLHAARPELSLAELAELLGQYGQDVSELDVAVVLGRVPRPVDYSVTRADAGPHHSEAPPPHQLVITVQQPDAITAGPKHREAQHPVPPVAPRPVDDDSQRPRTVPEIIDETVDAALAVSGLSKADAVRRVRDALPSLNAVQIAEHLTRRGWETTDGYVRTVNSRDAEKTKGTVSRARPASERSGGPYL